MKDLHSHLIFGIDDGSSNLEESIALLEKFYNAGVTDMILTPHYMRNTSYVFNNKKKLNLLNILKENYKNINLYLGNEVFIDENILELLNNKEISTLNNSRYLLIELPISSELKNTEDILYELLRNKIIPIIAHPERYIYIQKNINKLNDLLEMGVLLQGNYESLFGKYGVTSKKTLKKLLKKNMISFLSSDAHKINQEINANDVFKKVNKIVRNKDITNNLLDKNIEKVINNEKL